MPQLTDFPGKMRHFNIAVEIGGNYSAVGIALLNDERGCIVQNIISEHRGNVEMINIDILSRWVQGKGIPDCTWRGLLGILRAHCTKLAEDIEETLKSKQGMDICFPTCNSLVEYPLTSQTSSSTTTATPVGKPVVTSTRPHSTALTHLSDELRFKYAKYPLPHFSDPQCMKWMPHVSKKFVHPDIISKNDQEKQPDTLKRAFISGSNSYHITKEGSETCKQVKLAELLNVRSDEKSECILMEGPPGVGKSTLVWQVCHLWGKRELFDQYTTILLLPLRDKRVKQAKNLADLLLIYVKEKRTREQVTMDMGRGNGILIILDGLNELPWCLLSEQTIFTDILSGEVLSDTTILVTSQPSTMQHVLKCWRQRISKHFVLCGFTEDDIEVYTQSILSAEEIPEFQKYLSIHPHIQSIMYIPLHSAIVLAVYLEFKKLPKTLTELYIWLVKIILSQYLTDHPEYNRETRVFDETLSLELPQQVHILFKQLCQLAFRNVQEPIFSNLPCELHNLGFTVSFLGLFLPGSGCYAFLHFTIQQFLAAYHISHVSIHEQEQLLMSSREEDHSKNTMRFVAGITKFEGFSEEALKQVIELEINYYTGKEKCLDDYSLELLHECQNVSILDKQCTYLIITRLKPCNYLALGYCITNSACTWKLKLHNINSTLLDMLLQGLTDSETKAASSVKSIDLHFAHDVISTEVSNLRLASSEATFGDYCTQMYIKWEKWNIGFTCFCRWLSTCQLDTISLHYLPHDLTEVMSRTLSEVSSLKTLDMKGSLFTLKGMQAFALMLQQNQSITEVNIRSSDIDSNVASCLAEALRNNTTLRKMNLHGNILDERAALVIAEMLEYNTTLEVINMSVNSIGVRGALAMAEVLKCNSTLLQLNLSRNFICDEGALAIAEMLKQNTTLKELDLSWNSVSEKGTLAISEVLKRNTTLKVLNMRGNLAGESVALSMAEVLQRNEILEV